MSFDSIFSDISRLIVNEKNFSGNFADSKTNEERFKVTYDVCKKYIPNLNLEIITKSGEKSVKARKAGNEEFSKLNFWEALKLYNESIALAPNNSEDLALALGNRAASLLKLNYPNEALIDVEKALKLPAKADFRKKLTERKAKCLEVGSQQENSVIFGTGDPVSLSKKQSTFFESSSVAVGFFQDEYFGRHLIANEDIKTGEVIIIEKPYSSVLLPEYYYTHCAYCFKRNVNLIPCEKCSCAMFCSEECRTFSIKNFHKIECSILFVLMKLKAEFTMLLSLRLLIEASQQGKDLEKLYNDILDFKNKNNDNYTIYKSLDFINIYNLVTNSDKRPTYDLFRKSVASLILICVLEKYSEFFKISSNDQCDFYKIFSGGLILHLMQGISSNAHEISEFYKGELNEIGAGIYATLSLINHSCDPNVVRYSQEDHIVLYTIRPIKKGEQILDNYGYHYATHSLDDRQAALMKQYHFKCQCVPCVQLWPMYHDLPKEEIVAEKEIDMKLYKELTEEFEANLKKIFDGMVNKEILEKNMKYLDFLDEYVKRPWKDFNICQEAIKYCLSFYGNHFMLSKKVAFENSEAS